MNVSELLAFKPETPRTSTLENTRRDSRKAPTMAPPESSPAAPAKRSRISVEGVEAKYRRLEPTAPSSSASGNSTSTFAVPAPPKSSAPPHFDAAAALAALEAERGDDEANGEGETSSGVTEVNEATVRRMLLQLEKRSLKNQEMRVKHADEPQLFLQSEGDLYDILQELQVVGTAPELYPLLVQQSHCVPTLLQLVGHDNVDISLAVIELLHEWTEPETLQEAPEATAVLVEALLQEKIVALLVQNAARFKEANKDESEGIHNMLGIVENLVEYEPGLSPSLARQDLMSWLLKRIQVPTFEANKLYASEILAILMTGVAENVDLFGELNGIDIVLQQLSLYKRNDPTSREEGEMMQNLFDCLCAALTTRVNGERFLKGEGPQLMILMLRFKKLSRNNALRVLDYAMSNDQATETCNKFVDNFGVRHLFPLLMRPPKRRMTDQKRVGPSTAELEEHIINCVAGLLRHCSSSKKQRVLQKFAENDHEKTERIFELHFKYFENTKESDKKVEIEKSNPELWMTTSSEEMEEEVYNRRLIGGLFVLQQLDILLLDICVNGAASIKERVLKLLRMRGVSPRTICRIVEECADHLGEEAHAEKKRLRDLLEKFDALL